MSADERIADPALFPALVRSFARRGARAEDAEDLAQETLLRVQRGADTVADPERLDAWIGRIARNVWVDHLRRARPTEPLADDAPAAHDEYEAADAAPIVAGWVATLIAREDEPDRTILTLSEIEHRPAREIAPLVDLSVSGVKSRVQRGRARLRARVLSCCALEIDGRGRIVDWKRHGGRGRPICDSDC